MGFAASLLALDVGALGLGAGLALLAAIIGYRMRQHGHAILPFRDPVLIAIVSSQFVVLILAAIMPTDPVMIKITGDVPVLFAMMFDCGYLLGYIMCRPGDRVYVDLPTDDGGSEVIPLVHYTKNGIQYMMPQRLGAIIAGLMGIRYPLAAAIGSINNWRSMYATNGLIRLSMAVAPASYHGVDYVTVSKVKCGHHIVREGGKWRGAIVEKTPRYLFHFEVEAHTIIFSQATLDDPASFWRQQELYLGAIARAAHSEQHIRRLEVQLSAAAYDAGASLLEGMVQLTTDAPGYEDDLRRALAEERARRTKRERKEATDGVDSQ